jgi:hypothetical protein
MYGDGHVLLQPAASSVLQQKTPAIAFAISWSGAEA